MGFEIHSDCSLAQTKNKSQFRDGIILMAILNLKRSRMPEMIWRRVDTISRDSQHVISAGDPIWQPSPEPNTNPKIDTEAMYTTPKTPNKKISDQHSSPSSHHARLQPISDYCDQTEHQVERNRSLPASNKLEWIFDEINVGRRILKRGARHLESPELVELPTNVSLRFPHDFFAKLRDWGGKGNEALPFSE